MEQNQPKKSLGQHWLNDTATLDAICDAAKVEPGDVVLEIGPGTGELTARLLERKAAVVALEVDTSLFERLNSRFDKYLSTEFLLQAGDIRTYDLGNMPDKYKIVANIPYYLTAYLLRILTDELTHKPTLAALLVQKEVAERVTASPGTMSLLSVAVQFYWEVNVGVVVPARLFTPPPKVDSQVLVMSRRHQPLFPDVDTKHFFRVVKAGFAARRKTLLNSLAGGLRTDKERIQEILDLAQISASLRPQNLTLQEWYKLYQAALTVHLL